MLDWNSDCNENWTFDIALECLRQRGVVGIEVAEKARLFLLKHDLGATATDQIRISFVLLGMDPDGVGKGLLRAAREMIAWHLDNFVEPPEKQTKPSEDAAQIAATA